jgi:hypothetical protein
MTTTLPSLKSASAPVRVIFQLGGRLVFAQVTQVGGQVARRGQGVGVIVAWHPAAASQRVLIQLPRRLMLTQIGQVDGQVGRRVQVLGSSPSTRRLRAKVSASSSRAARYGRRRRKKVSGKNKTEVRTKFAELHDELNDGVVTVPTLR